MWEEKGWKTSPREEAAGASRTQPKEEARFAEGAGGWRQERREIREIEFFERQWLGWVSRGQGAFAPDSRGLGCFDVFSLGWEPKA